LTISLIDLSSSIPISTISFISEKGHIKEIGDEVLSLIRVSVYNPMVPSPGLEK
jgi:hypothetical protein